MIKAECDRCGTGVEIPAGTPPLSALLPDDWCEIRMQPNRPEVVGRMWQLCPGCITAFLAFFEGDGAVPGLLEPETLAKLTAEAQLDPRTIMRPECMAGQHITAGGSARCVYCGTSWQETDPEAAGRALWPVPDPEEPPDGDEPQEHEHDFGPGNMARCACGSTYQDVLVRTADLNGYQVPEFAGVDPAAPFGGRIPVGQKTAPCPSADDQRCPGNYRRGGLHEHMRAVHGVAVAEGSDACPYCPEIMKAGRVGAHIVSHHPGDWQAWTDEQARQGREKR